LDYAAFFIGKNMNDPTQLEGLVNFQPHSMATAYLESTAPIRVNIKGNQGGGTRVCMHEVALRALGIHPVEKRNDIRAPIRCISKCLPKNDEDEENQQYVEFKKIFPPEMVVRDINFRSHQMVVRNKYGQEIKIEFMSKKQEIDAFMSVQRQALYQDEEIDKIKWDENQMRLLFYDGDTTLTLTPVRGLDWTYDQIWCRAEKILRSKTICDRFGLPPVEIFDRKTGIEIFNWATDDNPAMNKASIERIFGEYNDSEDADELAMRRYGVFRQVSGRIYKEFDAQIHVIPWEKYWDAKKFSQYWHFRMIDYHQAKPWHISWVAISPQQEWFIWNELRERNNTDDIRDKIKNMSLINENSELNRRTLFDPLAKEMQSNSGVSMFDHIQLGPQGLRMCEVADTKNQQGRNNVIKRLKNSLVCGEPYNNSLPPNIINYDPRFPEHYPTIWFFDTCKGHIDYFRNWRTIEHKAEHVKAEKDEKRIMQRWSDFCRNIEFLASLDPIYYEFSKGNYEPKKYFHRESRMAG